jgi:hypothetical protein
MDKIEFEQSMFYILCKEYPGKVYISFGENGRLYIGVDMPEEVRNPYLELVKKDGE